MVLPAPGQPFRPVWSCALERAPGAFLDAPRAPCSGAGSALASGARSALGRAPSAPKMHCSRTGALGALQNTANFERSPPSQRARSFVKNGPFRERMALAPVKRCRRPSKSKYGGRFHHSSAYRTFGITRLNLAFLKHGDFHGEKIRQNAMYIPSKPATVQKAHVGPRGLASAVLESGLGRRAVFDRNGEGQEERGPCSSPHPKSVHALPLRPSPCHKSPPPPPVWGNGDMVGVSRKVP
jgi:hypothetical protein